MTYIISSDCRTILKPEEGDSTEEGRHYLGEKFTWVKADPTFEGLKQMIYEPEVRVGIQERNPGDDFKKPFFSKITLNAGRIFDKEKPQFSKDEFPINRDLVAIIGGRGTGKSLLLDAVKKTFQNSDYFMSDARYSHRQFYYYDHETIAFGAGLDRMG